MIVKFYTLRFYKVKKNYLKKKQRKIPDNGCGFKIGMFIYTKNVPFMKHYNYGMFY